MSAGRLAVHVCTRNRPAALRQLLQDLAPMLDGVDTEMTVYDDSTRSDARAGSRAETAAAAFPVRYFDEQRRRELVARAWATVPSAAGCLATSRPLGARGWDLAGVRFTALLHAALDPDPLRLHLFLDDDLRLRSCTYAGHSFDVDLPGLRDLLAAVPGDGPLATGARLAGRADLSALEHYELHLDTVEAEGRRWDGSPVFPAAISSAAHVHPESPGVSGGFLLTDRRAIRAVPLSRSYDEDWIWLRQLGLAGGTVRPLDCTVVHAGTESLTLKARTVVLQFDGEVLDAALRRCAEEGGPVRAWERYVDEALQLCRGRLAAVAARVPPSYGNGQVLHVARARTAQRRPSAYRAHIRAHLRRSAEWADAFATLGD